MSPESGSFRDVGERLSNWGRWGADDRLGTLNLLTPESVVAAAREVRRGAVFDLGLDVSARGPQCGASGRPNPIHSMAMMHTDFELPGGLTVADDAVQMPLQSVCQWDGLAHIGYDGRLYNDVPTASVTAREGSRELSIDQIARKGVAGRGVLLDLARLHGVDSLDAGYAIAPAELEEAERVQGARLGAGDILLLRTGWLSRFTRDGDALGLWEGEPGLSLACAEWLHSRDVAAVVADNWGVEVQPAESEGDSLPLHAVLIRDMGMSLGELADLDELAADCAEDGVWSCLFCAPPLKVTGGVGSPITPLAIK